MNVDKCDGCYYNFDGYCAWHSGGEFDTYGQKVNSIICNVYCDGFRRIPWFFKPQFDNRGNE